MHTVPEWEDCVALGRHGEGGPPKGFTPQASGRVTGRDSACAAARSAVPPAAYPRPGRELG